VAAGILTRAEATGELGLMTRIPKTTRRQRTFTVTEPTVVMCRLGTAHGRATAGWAGSNKSNRADRTKQATEDRHRHGTPVTGAPLAMTTAGHRRNVIRDPGLDRTAHGSGRL